MLSHFLRKVWPFGRALPGAPPMRAAGHKWRLTAEAATIFGPAGPDLERWLADGRAEVVKTGAHRTVYRVTLPTGVVYVKHCRINGPRAWLREVLRPPKAQLEFDNALTLRERGVPAVVPLAWGRADSRWPGESFLITRSREEVVPFVEFLERDLPALQPESRTALRRQIARTLGQFMALLHDAGVAHPDPHPGNLLFELPASHVPRFYLIDLHAIRIDRPLNWAESRANIILFNRWFQLRATRSDRLRFWHAYRRSRRTLPAPSPVGDAAQAREVEQGTAASNIRFWSARQVRYHGTRHFRPVRDGPVRGLADRGLPEAFLRELLADPDAMFSGPGARLLKDCTGSTVAEIALPTPDGPRAVILKRVRVRRWFDPVKNFFRPSPAWRSWVAGHSLRDRGLPTPLPLAVLHRYRFGLPAEGYLLTNKVPGAIGLLEAVAGLVRMSQREAILRGWIDRLARTVRLMHDRAVSHRDLKAPNVLLEAAAIPVLVDLVGVRLGRLLPFARRVKELARLNASFLTSPVVTRSHRLRFLRSYLAAGPASGASWKDWWRGSSHATAVKVAKNRRTGRVLG